MIRWHTRAESVTPRIVFAHSIKKHTIHTIQLIVTDADLEPRSVTSGAGGKRCRSPVLKLVRAKVPRGHDYKDERNSRHKYLTPQPLREFRDCVAVKQ